MGLIPEIFNGGLGVKEGGVIYLRIGAPISTFGEVTDYWLDLVSRTLYQKTGISVWTTIISDFNVNLLNLQHQTVSPSNPLATEIKVFSRKIAGRGYIRQLDEFGESSGLQSIFDEDIYSILTNQTNSLTSQGDSITSVGTISHPAPSQNFGRMANIISGAAAGNTAGTGFANANFVRGNIVGENGFFFYCRMVFPDANYNETGASTGSRIFVGLTDQSMAGSVANNDPVGNRLGFQRLHVNGSTLDTNWFLSSKNNVTENRIDTLMPFLPSNVYDFYIFCPRQGSTVFWRIENKTSGVIQEGQTSANLPVATTYLRAGFQIQTVNALARNVRFRKLYVEVSR